MDRSLIHYIDEECKQFDDPSLREWKMALKADYRILCHVLKKYKDVDKVEDVDAAVTRNSAVAVVGSNMVVLAVSTEDKYISLFCRC